MEEAGHPEFLVWREVGEEELMRGLWMVEGEEGHHVPLWMGEEGVELSSGGEEEEEVGGRHVKEVEGVRGAPASSARS